LIFAIGLSVNVGFCSDTPPRSGLVQNFFACDWAGGQVGVTCPVEFEIVCPGVFFYALQKGINGNFPVYAFDHRRLDILLHFDKAVTPTALDTFVVHVVDGHIVVIDPLLSVLRLFLYSFVTLRILFSFRVFA
jgi:hypothetical protein